MKGILPKVNAVLRTEGVGGLARIVSYRVSEAWHDRRLNIRTPRGRIHLDEFGLGNPEYVFYQPTPYAAIYDALDGLPATDRDVFVDFGCGMGRVLAVAATKPFRRVVGVDLVQTFVDRTLENIERAQAQRRCAQVEVRQANVLDFEIPDDMTVAHFFNPFRGETLRKVIGNLKASIERAPRRVTVLFANPADFDKAISGQDWVHLRAEKPWPYRPANSHPEYEIYRIYDANAPCVARRS